MSATVPAPAPRLSTWRRRLLTVVVTAVALLAAGGALFVWIALHWAYSDGERAGYVQKFSRKGWVCKTWEGELALVALPGSTPEIFRFTVRDEAVAARINQDMGQRVTLHYEQHKFLPTSCFGETEYFAVDVRVVDGR